MGKSLSTSSSCRIEIWLAEIPHANTTSTTSSTSSNIPFLAKLLSKTRHGDRVNEFERTNMYRVHTGAGGKEHARAKARRDGGGGEDTAIGSESTEDWVKYSDGRGLMAKKERLERAARLLRRVQGGS